MAPDISSLNLKQLDPVDYDKYETSSGPSAPPHAGRYTGRAPENIEFSAGGDGQLIAALDPITIVGGERDGYPVRFTRISNKRPVSKKTGTAQNRTIMDDYLHANGVNAAPQSHEEYAQLVEATAGRTFEFEGDWEVYSKTLRTTVLRGEASFPLNEDGSHNPTIRLRNGVMVTDGTQQDSDEVLRANFRITRFISAL